MKPRQKQRAPLYTAMVLSLSCVGPTSSPGLREIAEPDKSLSRDFSNITSLVELSDGRVVFSDPREGALFVADFDRDSVRTIGTEGSGPHEYSNAIGLVGFGNDSILQVDGLTRRWLVLYRDSIVGQLSPDDPLLADVPMVLGADQLGNVLHQASPRLTPGGATVAVADSMSSVLISRSTRTRDTVALLRPSPPHPTGVDLQYYFLAEQALLFPDGWLAVIRLEPYRVDWRSAAGAWTYGPPIALPRLPLDASEREWLGAAVSATRAGAEWEQRLHWPEFIPDAAFQFHRLLTPDGDILIRRQANSQSPQGLYDRVDRRGLLKEQVRVAPNQRILQVGARHAYVVTSNDDGLQFLSRHPWR